MDLVVDVRTLPASRRLPHFAKAALETSLQARGIGYLHMPELGGLRKPKLDSINTGWRNASFRGYADYMQQPEFWKALEGLERLEVHQRVAIMCAEAVPWRCHRSLIADALTVRGVHVKHITDRSDPSVHKLTPFTLVTDGRITYPAPDRLPI